MRGGQIEIAARSGEGCLLLLGIETVSSSFRKLVSFERFENCVTEIGLRGDGRSWRVALFVNVLDQAFGALDQVIVPAIRDARRNPRKKSFKGALLRSIRFSDLLPRKLNIEIPRPGQTQRRRQIDRNGSRRRVRFACRCGKICKERNNRGSETAAFHFASVG